MPIKYFQGQENLFQGDNEKLDEANQIGMISDKISELFNMKNIHFLFGSGTSAGSIPTMWGLYEMVVKVVEKQSDPIKKEFALIQKKVSEKGQEGNLEEILGILYSHRVYLSYDELYDKIVKDSPVDLCFSLISIIEKVIFDGINIEIKAKSSGLELYRKFYRKVALRNKDLSRINIFTTNNDLFNEVALDSLNIHYINGFGGGLNKYFNPALFDYTYSKRMDANLDKYEPVENMVKLYKIHGSVNWIEDSSKKNSYFKIREVTEASLEDDNVLVYPTPTKQNKSLGSPYVELFREFQKKLMEPMSVLFVIGYSFSDEHVNNVIYQALATNTTMNLVIINDVTSKPIADIDDNRIFKIWEEDEKVKEVKIAPKGKEVGQKTTEAGEPLAKTETVPAIDENVSKAVVEKVKAPVKLHYFERIIEELLPDVDAFKNPTIDPADFLSLLQKKSG